MGRISEPSFSPREAHTTAMVAWKCLIHAFSTDASLGVCDTLRFAFVPSPLPRKSKIVGGGCAGMYYLACHLVHDSSPTTLSATTRPMRVLGTWPAMGCRRSARAGASFWSGKHSFERNAMRVHCVDEYLLGGGDSPKVDLTASPEYALQVGRH